MDKRVTFYVSPTVIQIAPMMYRSYSLSVCFITHSHSSREDAHTHVACTLCILYERINSRIVSVFSFKGAQMLGGPGRRSPERFYRILVNRSGKKFHTPRTYLRPIFALIRLLSPLQPLLHLLLSPLSLCSNLFFCEYCIHHFF